MVSRAQLIGAVADRVLREPQSKISFKGVLRKEWQDCGLHELAAEERAEADASALEERLAELLVAWDREGVPRPLTMASGVAFGTLSGRYKEGLADDFFLVLEDLSTATEHSLLGFGVLHLFSLGCRRIFVVDKGGGDLGVDVLALWQAEHNATAVILALQCKALQRALSSLEVHQVADRIRHGLGKPRWDEYFRAMNAESVVYAPAIAPGLLASKGLGRSGAETARAQGCYASSPRQVAHDLSSRWSYETISDFVRSVPSSRDLSRELSREAQLLPERTRTRVGVRQALAAKSASVAMSGES